MPNLLKGAVIACCASVAAFAVPSAAEDGPLKYGRSTIYLFDADGKPAKRVKASELPPASTIDPADANACEKRLPVEYEGTTYWAPYSMFIVDTQCKQVADVTTASRRDTRNASALGSSPEGECRNPLEEKKCEK